MRLLALATKLDLTVHQMDITIAYLHGIIKEEIYMEVPEMLTEYLKNIERGGEYNVKSRAKKMLKQVEDDEKACRLQKAFYDLKQAGRQ